MWFKEPAKILPCDCKHESQDKLYGVGLRVFNPCKSGASATGFRCTVCGKKK